MSGIEVFSCAVGLVSLSIQLGESGLRLKRIYNAAKDAPRHIESLVFDLETMAIGLRELEHLRSQGKCNDVFLARCATNCDQSTSEIRLLIDKMERCMASSFKLKGRLYAVFKEPDMKDLLNNLERTKSSLMLAFTMYNAAEQRQRDQEQVRLVSSIQDQLMAANADTLLQLSTLFQSSLLSPAQRSLPTTVSADRTSLDIQNQPCDRQDIDISPTNQIQLRCHSPSPRSKRNKGKTKVVASFRLPTWLCSRVWKFAVISDRNGWDTLFRTYRIVSRDSQIFQLCIIGTLAAFRRLIDSGEESALVVFSGYNESITLLEYAASCGRIDICRYLVALGGHIDASQALAKALGRWVWFDSDEDADDVYRLFLNAPEWDYELGGPCDSPQWLQVCPNSHCFQLILRSQCHELRPWSVEDRFELLTWNYHIGCAQFLDCIGLTQSDHRLANLKTDIAFTVLHYVVFRLSANAYDAQEWLNLGKSLIMNGADPSAITVGGDGRTPLGSMMLNMDEAPSMWLTRLRLWIQMLQETDIDLESYGAKESQRWIPTFIDRYSNCLIEGLIYGPTTENWSLVFSWRRQLPIYRLLHTPGTFNISHHVPERYAGLQAPMSW